VANPRHEAPDDVDDDDFVDDEEEGIGEFDDGKTGCRYTRISI
jgi:hypothetical protein